MFIADILRHYSLKKHGSKVPTCIMPVKDIRTAAAIIDVEDSSFNACENSILDFYREYGIKGELYYLDLRELKESDESLTDRNRTVFRKDLGFFGRPAGKMLDIKPDLLISLVNRNDYAICYMAGCCEAKFKVGRKQLPGDVFDLVVCEQENGEETALPEVEVFKSIKELMLKVK